MTTRLDRNRSSQTLRPALLAALLFPACGGAPPSAAPPPSESDARRVAQAALSSLSRRQFDVAGCSAGDARVVAEAEASAGVAASNRCALLVARRADETWLVVVRAPERSGPVQAGTVQAGMVQAFVSVSPGGDGVVGIDYKP